VASLSCGLGLPYRRWTDCLRPRRAVLHLAPRSRMGRSGHDQPIYASRLGSCNSCRSEDTTPMDGVLHLLGDRLRRMGRSPKHCTEAPCQAIDLTRGRVPCRSTQSKGGSFSCPFSDFHFLFSTYSWSTNPKITSPSRAHARRSGCSRRRRSFECACR
jgi:hypothetical protein